MQIMLLLERSIKLDGIVSDCFDFALPADDATELVETGWEHFALQSALMKHFVQSEGKLLFNSTFKSHWLMHSILISSWVSPRDLSRRHVVAAVYLAKQPEPLLAARSGSVLRRRRPDARRSSVSEVCHART